MRSSKTHYLPEHVGFYSTNDSESLALDLSQNISEVLVETIKKRGRASIAVSGGSTPIPLFEALSRLNLDWGKVDLTLVDDRWVESDNKDSNELLVRTHLIKNKAVKVNFVPLKNNSSNAKKGQMSSEKALKSFTLPFDVVVLGMGTDGHTASLFPCSEEIKLAMDLNNDDCLVATTPTSAPYERLSLTAKAIIDAKNVFLHLNGSSKLHTLEEAMNTKDTYKMPIYAFLEDGLDIYWSP
ncbi:MAG: 6-phosphogluconolactonase [Thiotrichales bacterium]|nr:6-phosphogluconolactonase [Thiotrichales bacterium]MBT3854725.1 6-phosphogluconolactonase [Thiotrichales bacterium]MBT4653715.1 6-phosphogluconolactonase [Thiotrichales bacterium]MBT5500095.1 6-phosphogluconolactonase [Thiotrichales bacterium]MBT5984651.1 6-phosphogluconolactonase [Thiotrichales bacterium]|tara:strand:- start:8616 stop:9335 length:720 start_codon:yes stop_codon:yes gene_type:complete